MFIQSLGPKNTIIEVFEFFCELTLGWHIILEHIDVLIETELSKTTL